GSIIILYLFSIISTCYYTPRLECQPCQEPKMSTMYGSSTPRHTNSMRSKMEGSDLCGSVFKI
ncbi:MAG: hypothetical protein WBF33_08510, partial [Candidatus Nitrosopolaris sp.]